MATARLKMQSQLDRSSHCPLQGLHKDDCNRNSNLIRATKHVLSLFPTVKYIPTAMLSGWLRKSNKWMKTSTTWISLLYFGRGKPSASSYKCFLLGKKIKACIVEISHKCSLIKWCVTSLSHKSASARDWQVTDIFTNLFGELFFFFT